LPTGIYEATVRVTSPGVNEFEEIALELVDIAH